MPVKMRCTTFKAATPTLTEKNLPDQEGKVFMVTGGSSGVGKELVKILYQHNAKIYIATRSRDKTEQVMQEIHEAHPGSRGQMLFLSLQLDDLSTIKASAQEFLSKEDRLDVLWNNAGVMEPPEGSVTKQGYELQLGTNVLGHFLFTEFLRPALLNATRTAAPGSVRVVVVASAAADEAPKPAIDFDNMDYHKDEGIMTKYRRSKAGNALHAVEYARRHSSEGIVCVALHPGFLVTNLQNNFGAAKAAAFKIIGAPAINGAYTELFGGLDNSITLQNSGRWIAPYGRIEEVRKDLQDPYLGRKYWAWMEAQVSPYM